MAAASLACGQHVSWCKFEGVSAGACLPGARLASAPAAGDQKVAASKALPLPSIPCECLSSLHPPLWLDAATARVGHSGYCTGSQAESSRAEDSWGDGGAAGRSAETRQEQRNTRVGGGRARSLNGSCSCSRTGTEVGWSVFDFAGKGAQECRYSAWPQACRGCRQLGRAESGGAFIWGDQLERQEE